KRQETRDKTEEMDDGPQSPRKSQGYGYRELIVWQKGIELGKRIYRLTQEFPSEEKFGLVSQMRRSAVSIPSNVAEGQARHTTKEFIQFVSHAEGSLAELDTQVRLAVELGYCSHGDTAGLSALMEEVRRMLNRLRRNLAAKS
ncbi:MAG: four helix bundle protein, partial [Terriglobia bacterium]